MTAVIVYLVFSLHCHASTGWNVGRWGVSPLRGKARQRSVIVHISIYILIYLLSLVPVFLAIPLSLLASKVPGIFLHCFASFTLSSLATCSGYSTTTLLLREAIPTS